MLPDLTTVNETVCTYLCGGCGYHETSEWAQHQAHYKSCQL